MSEQHQWCTRIFFLSYLIVNILQVSSEYIANFLSRFPEYLFDLQTLKANHIKEMNIIRNIYIFCYKYLRPFRSLLFLGQVISPLPLSYTVFAF